jgi:hypothetical protein
VFATSNGTPYSTRNVLDDFFKPLMKNPKVVSERLGHASIMLTLDTYSHVLPTMQKSANEETRTGLVQEAEPPDEGKPLGPICGLPAMSTVWTRSGSGRPRPHASVYPAAEGGRAR